MHDEKAFNLGKNTIVAYYTVSKNMLNNYT